MNEEIKICQNCKQSFKIEPNDFGFYEKMKVPVPEDCPECRQQLRMVFRNFKTLYKRKCDKSDKMIVSMYDSNTPFPVYDISEWWGDSWEGGEYAMDIDWEAPFFTQLALLHNKVPHISLVNVKSENSDYSNMVFASKNTYLLFGNVENEDCDYGHIVWNSRDSIDNLYLFKSESCYECVDCLGSTKLFYSQESESCVDSIGLFDCRNCLNCIGCVGQVNKSYCIFNKQVTREAYKEFLAEHPLNEKSSIDYILNEREALRKVLPQRSFFGSHNDNVSGNHIYNAHNIQHSFDIKSGENSSYCYTVRSAIDSYDVTFTVDVSECYEAINCIGNKLIGCHNAYESHDVYFSHYCYNCDNIFGCFGLRKKSYCIFNKQYTKEEYQDLLPKLIEHMKKNNEWGTFFPKELSPFAYNEAIGNEYMPLSKEEALAQGFTWKDHIPSTTGQGTIENSNLPKNPEEYSDELLKEIFTCTSCSKNYKLINREINFYKKNKLALPEQCFNCRHTKRMQMRNPRNLWPAKCAKCEKEILTSYTPEGQTEYNIYCEKCYQQEVY